MRKETLGLILQKYKGSQETTIINQQIGQPRRNKFL